MSWQDTFFVWWTELDDPPTPDQLRFWTRTRAPGQFRYFLRGLLQYSLLVVLFVVVLLVSLGVNWWFLFNVQWLLSLVAGLFLALSPFMVQLHLRWKKNERVYQA